MKKYLKHKPAGGGAYKSLAFTLAEVLITLAIIGVVAALTIPTLINNYQKQQYVTQLKKSYSVLSNGVKAIMANDGATRFIDTTLYSSCYNSKKHFDQPKCNSEISKTFPIISSSSSTVPRKTLNSETDPAFGFGPYIVLKDGTFLHYYFSSPDVVNDLLAGKYYTNINIIGSFTVDVNGDKKPNTFGRDVFLFHLYNNGSVYPSSTKFLEEECEKYGGEPGIDCDGYWKTTNSDWYNCSTEMNSTGEGCSGRIIDEGWQMTY